MNDYQEAVQGRILDRDGSPVAGATVEVFDKDMLLNDYLGSATTDAEGRYRVDFSWADYKDNLFEARPDVFLKVKNPTTGKVSKSKVFRELSGDLADDDSIELMDLGDFTID